jgi:hypothetical protein
MYKAAVYNSSNIPSHLRHLLVTPASAVLVIENETSVLEYFTGATESDLGFLADQMNRAYKLGKGVDAPSFNECALAAHEVAEHYEASAEFAVDALQKEGYNREARHYHDVCDRYLRGLTVSPLVEDDKVIAYYLRGDGGYAYRVDTGATHCSCHVGLKSKTKICWHIRAIECYLRAEKKHGK